MSKPNLVMDFGGTIIKLAIMRDGNVIVRSAVNNHSDAGDLDKVAELALDLCAENGLSVDDLGGVGLSAPGIINADAKVPLSINGKYDYMEGVDLGAWGQARFGLPLVVDNDARMALCGEVGYGVARGATNAVIMILGTGVGTAAMIDGRLLRGAHHQAGILGGHLTIETNGYLCNCGNRGCVEAEAGSWNMPTIVRHHPGFAGSVLSRAEVLDFKAIVEAHRAGDQVATDVFARLIQCWAIGVVNLIHAYDPEVIVLSGGLMKAHDFILAPLHHHVAANAWVPSGLPDFRIAADSNLSVLMGLDHTINYTDSKARQ